MKSHAKASSAASTMRQAKGRGGIVRGAFATRGGSGDADGSGASSARGKAALLGFLSLALAGLVLVASSAFASKEVIQWFGNASSSGPLGGEFSGIRDVAVNSTGAGGVPAGTIYVAEEGNNSRIQRFAPDGSFVAAWGANVLTEGVDEKQAITVNATAGTYTLGFEGATTAPLPYNATSSEMSTALRALSTTGGTGNSNIGVGGTAPSFTVSFSNNLQATNVPQLSVDDSALTGSISTTTTTEGSGAYEICTVAANCLRGLRSGGANGGDTAKNGSLNRPQSVAVDGDTGNIYVSDRDDRRINEYTATGTFIRSFGWGVDASTPGSEYEICPATDRCTFGIAGAGVGQIGAINTAGTDGIAVSPPDGNASTGKVFLADSQNRRVNTYNLDGTSPSSFGSATNFATTNPRKIAVDSRGIVYASDSNAANRINRYDSENANGGGTVFLAPIASPPLLAGPASTATSGLAVDPDSDGAGPDEDVLYVLRDPTSGNTVVQQFGPTNDPGLTTAPTAVDDTHGAGAGFAAVNGLGLNIATGRLYVSAATAVSGLPASDRVYVLGETPAPEATLDPVTTFNAHSATFSGSVDPNGSETGYRFEYVDDANFQATGFASAVKSPIADANAGLGESPVSVEQETPHHLIPSTLYHVRLVAKRTFTSVETIAGPQTFTTPGSAPSFETTAAAGEEEATLRAAIDPEGQAVTNYHFDWGPTDAYGNSTPAGNLPLGSEPVAVEEELSGLTPGQTYHYRLVATNGTGTTNGPDETFTPTTPPPLPQRGYEIASQYPTGGPAISELGGEAVNEDGDSVAITAVDPLAHSSIPVLPDDPPNDTIGGNPQYVFTRGADSWQHRTDVGIGGTSWSADLRRLLIGTVTEAPGSEVTYEDARVDPDDHNHSLDLYQWQADGGFVRISRDPRISAGTPETTPGEANLAYKVGSFTMSADGRTVVFKSQRQLLDADTSVNVGTNPDNWPFRLYKWEDGQLSFIGKRPDGSVPADGSELGEYSYLASDRYAVSRDGTRVIFSALRRDGIGSSSKLPGAITGAGIYVQADGQPTVEATKEEGVPALPAPEPYNVTYRGAAEDDSRVFFTSASRFTPDSGGGATKEGATDLYVYDVATNKLRDLTPRLDGIEDPSLDPAVSDRARVLGVAANSADGKRVYFVAEGAYPTAPNPEGELPQASSPNLYMAELDSIDEPVKLRFIGTVAAGEEGDWSLGWGTPQKTALASSDGTVFGFASRESLTGQPLGGTQQLFVYDAESGTLKCPSCPSDGSLPTRDVNQIQRFIGILETFWQFEGLKRWVTDEGTVFFSTVAALLPSDQNLYSDVYEYREGRLGLVTSGNGVGEASFANASVDGSTAFINTREALAPQDKEPGIPKLYAARVGGGFPYVPPPVPCDFNAGACEGTPSTATQTPGAGSATFEGPGNPKPQSGRRCPKGKREVRRRGKVRCVKAHRKHHGRLHHKRNAKHNGRTGR